MIPLLLSATLFADPLTEPETSYYGASILDGDVDITFNQVYDLEQSTSPDTYAFFEGSTLYVGNSDSYGNSVDGIVEFFWFQSSIDRGTDFYVAVIKVRATPGHDCPWYLGGTECELWADDWYDFGEYPVVSVEAITDVSREQGAFRWDWAVPFENYGIDAYGQMSFSNQYGIGSSSQSGAEGSAMTAVTIPEGANINGIPVQGGANANAEIQVKGYLTSDYKVQTQYDVTLYEWDVYVNGRADLMAWDVYLNLGQRADQSAYHEFFLPIQVELGESFRMDQFNFLATFDTGNINPLSHQIGLSLNDVEINAPFWEPEEEPEPSSEPTDDPAEEVDETVLPEDTGIEDTSTIDENENEGGMPALDGQASEPVKSCSTASVNNPIYTWIEIIFVFMLTIFRRKGE